MSVGQIHRSVREHLVGLARRTGVLWGAVVLALVLLAAWLAVGSEGWRAGTPVPLLLDILLVLVAAAGVRAALVWRRGALSEARVSRGIEEAAGLPDGAVLGSLELARDVPPGVSASLVRRRESHLVDRLELPAATLAGAEGRRLGRWNRRGLALLGALVPLLVLALVLAPGRSARAWQGLGSPIGWMAGPVLPPLVLEPGDVELLRGTELRVVVRASGRDSVQLHWQPAGDVTRDVWLAVDGGVAGHGFGPLGSALSYWASAPDGAVSERYEATPVDPLFVTDVTIRLEFPAYTARPAEEYRGEAPRLEVPLGTRIEVEGRGSRALSAAELVPLDSAGVVDPRAEAVAAFEPEGSLFGGSFVPRRSGTWGWRFVDVDGGSAELVPRPLEVILIPDLPPVVEITLPAPDTVLPVNLRQPLVIQAADDYGVDSLELVAWRVTALGEPEEPVRQSVDLGGVPGALARPVLDVSEWGLLAGDQVRYFARVVDNSPARQEARTPEFVLRMPDAAGLRRTAQEELERGAEALEELAEQARRAAEEGRERELQANAPDRNASEPFEPSQDAGGQVGFEEREDLRRTLEEQRAMAERVDSLRRELEALSQTLQEAGARDPELRDDLRELQELLEEVSGPELRDRLAELSESMEQLDQQGAREALEELVQREEEFRDRIEQALDRMKRAAVQQDFRATTEEAQELAEQERALSEAMAEPEGAEQRAGQQEELGERTQAMEERMERLQERLEELGEPDAAQGVEQARQQAQDAREGMEAAAEQARRQQSQEASAQAGEAAEQMSEAARQLQQAQQQMMQERAAALTRALEQTTQDALALARRQGELRESMRGASGQELADMRADVAALEQGVRNMAENLSVAARAAGAPGAERQLGQSMGEAMQALSETVQALDAPSAAGRSPTASADQAVEALNQLAMQSVAAAQALSEGAEGAASPEQMMEALEQLAQQQADVNNQASEMMPMQLSPQAMQQQMQQMSQGQQSVASDLGELSDQEGEGPLGDLEALAMEAEALARELEQGRLEPETRRRQERLFHRLLDAGRSLEKDELSDERESTAAGIFEQGDVAALDRDALGLLRFRAPDPETLGRLPPAARALVLRYFQRLNAGGGPAPGVDGPGGGR